MRALASALRGNDAGRPRRAWPPRVSALARELRADLELQSVRELRIVRRREAGVATPPLGVDGRARDLQRGLRIPAERADRERVEVDRERARAVVVRQRIPAGVHAGRAPDRRSHALESALERDRGLAVEAVEQ